MAQRPAFAVLFALLAAVPLAPAEGGGTKLFEVPAHAETTTARTLEDAADDAEVWLNPANGADSRILATDKKSGLMVLDVAGRELEFHEVGRVNNVDLREGWTSGSVLIGASNRTKGGVSFFTLDPATTKVRHEEASFLATDLADPYGFCLYRSQKDQGLHAFVIGKDGDLRQYALTAGEGGSVSGTLVRKLAFGSIAEGCVADDRTGHLYVADELRGIWRLSADPETGDAKDMILAIDGTHIVDDIEGLTLAPSDEAGGYLIASIQGNSTFALIELPEAKLVARFSVTANSEKGIDEVTGTDGIAVRLGNFGPGLESGMLVVQDDINMGAPQNFKIVSWGEVLKKLGGSQ